MLLIVFDQALRGETAAWIKAVIKWSVDRRVKGVVLAGALSDSDMWAAEGSIVAMFDDEPEQSLQSAASAAAGVIVVTTGPSGDSRRKLGLDTSESSTVALGVVVVSKKPIDGRRLRFPLAADWVRVVSPTVSRAGQRSLGKVGRWAAESAAAPHRLGRLDGPLRREVAAETAMDQVRDLLQEEGVEEFQIRGTDAMYVLRSDGSREKRSSPFGGDTELIDAIKFLAAYGGDHPQRFDQLDPRLDIQISGQWRLHAEAYVTSPPNMVLRFNRGRTGLSELSVADSRLKAVLQQAVSGKVRANLVIASTMGGGKTTLCQALLAKVPEMERIDTIEDTPELRLAAHDIHPNTYERLTRDANNDGFGKHSMSDHIRDAKRANTSKLVVGEVRGEGTLALLDAMSSGLDGCLVTVHSRPGAAVIEKLIAYAVVEGADAEYARRQIASAVHLLVWLGRNTYGDRVVGDVTELVGIDERTSLIRTQQRWSYRPGDRWASPVGGSPDGRLGELYEAAGVRL